MTLTVADRASIALFPELGRLIALRNNGRWQFMPGVQQGGVELVAGFAVWLPEGWTDAIAGRGDARADRCDPAGGEVWGREGGLADVLDGLTELPAPPEPAAALRAERSAAASPAGRSRGVPGLRRGVQLPEDVHRGLALVPEVSAVPRHHQTPSDRTRS